MKTQKEIEDLIEARLAERQSVIDQHEKERLEIQKLNEAFQKSGAERQLKVTHLEGIIAGYRALLPKPKKSKSEKPS